MGGYTANHQPQISILMAVYEPRMDWLQAQLASLNAQTYPHLRLFIRDDCSPTVPYAQIRACVETCITAFPWEIRRNGQNLGSRATFERLTQEAEGDCFAYCDQDDVWLPEKLTLLHQALEKEQALLVCSDMLVIDGDGRLTANSITRIRRHHVFRSGAGLAQGLLFSNFVTGCTMLVRSGEAKAAIPFCPYMVHDHYLALWCAERGKLFSLRRPLIQYRVHGGNQTQPLNGVTDKESYGQVRIQCALQKLEWLAEHFPGSGGLMNTIGQGVVWMRARQQHWRHQGGGETVWKYRRFSPLPSMAELLLANAPEWLFRHAISLVKRNRI